MVAYLLALTSKENGVVFLPLLILTSLYWRLTTQKSLPKKAVFGITAALLMTAAYLVLKFTVLNFTKTIGLTDDVNAYTQDLGLRLTTFLHVLWDYAVLIVAPIDLFYEKPYTAYPGFSHPRAWFGIGLLALSAVVVLRAKRAPRVALGLAVMWAALLPYTGVIPVNAMYLEHWLYVPMVGLTVMAASLISWLQKSLTTRSQARLGALASGLILVLAMVYRTSTRAADWADPERFYLGEIAHGSVAARTYNNLGLYYSEHEQPDKAARYWQLAADSATSRPYPQPYHNLARYYLERGQLQEGLKQLHLALKADKNFVYSLALLGDIFAKLGEAEKTRAIQAAFDKAVRGETYDYAALEVLLFLPEEKSVH
jgi:tetratricopeptide (TPR) repeat protein